MNVPGTPRLVPVVGGELPVGSPDPMQLILDVGTLSIGTPPSVEIVVADDGLTVLRALLGTVDVDGRAVEEIVLTHGNRIALPGGPVVFQADKLDDDGGRQGGEQLNPARAVDALDRN